MSDLWGFKNVKELEKNTRDMPDSILKEQIALLSDKTNYVLYGKPVSIKITNSEEIDYGLATLFNIIVPKLDNYAKTILIMYSQPEEEYPVAITIGSSYEDDCEDFQPQYVCNNTEEFITAISEILSSNDILHIVGVLYAKASMLDG